MPIIAQYDFNDTDSTALDSALGNGAQNGTYRNGAEASGGQAVLDGQDDLVKIYPSEAFQMDRGTLTLNFTLNDAPLDHTQTVLSRDSVGQTAGGYHIDILADGSVVVSHETPSGTTTFGTAPGFAHPGDSINLSYSWDQGGTGGALVVNNTTTGADHSADVPNTLTMDQGSIGINQPWIVGAGQSLSNPEQLNDINQHFGGTVDQFTLSDTVDNVTPDDDPVANPDTATTDEDTPVTIDVLTNDSDPNGGPLTVTTATSPNGTVTINGDGTLHYTPDENFNGTDTITYTIRDPQGHTATSTVTVTVNPVNDDPVANPDTATTTAGTPVTVPVLANDTDVDGDPLSILGTPTSADGSITVNPDGSLTFTPNPGFTGEAVVNYEVSDGHGGTSTSTLTVTVNPTTPGRDGIVTGTSGNDVIDSHYTGDPDGDVVDGNDALIPGDGPNDDRIYAGDGDDTARGGLGDDLIYGGNGNDSLDGDSGSDTLYGGDGDDTLQSGGDGNDSLFGGNGNDSVRAGDGDDYIDTSGGGPLPLPDRGYPGLYPADSNPLNDLDTVYGGNGNDTILTGDDADLVYGGNGNDSVDAGFDDDTVHGGSGNDTIIAAEGADEVYGGDGDDLIYGGYGPGVPDAVNIPDATDLRPDNGTDLLYGGDGNDTIYGMDDDDTLYGGAGDDYLDGNIDDDLLFGGAGQDTLLGSEGDDTLFGGAGTDSLDGGIGDDVIFGGDGNDTIIGGAGADTLFGGNDRDLFIGGGAGDYIDGNEGGDDYDTLDLSGAGPLVIHYADDNPENGTVDFLDDDGNVTGTLTFRNIENVIPCFTPGTLIATPKGEVPVETLKAGDRIITRDNGIQEIRWTGQKQLGWHDLAANPHLKPVLIRQGSLGNGLPERDMMVSPNHRLLVANDRTALYFDEHEVLVSAKHLVAGAGIQTVDSLGTTYIHFMFDRHEVVLSNGAWTESFQPGDYTLKGMGNAQRGEIFELFPELKTEAGLEDYQAARRTLKRHEARLLVK